MTSLQDTREGLDVKKLRTDLDRAIDELRRRIEQGDPTKRLSQTVDAFSRWTTEIDEIVCVAADVCGNDMFIGS